MLNLFAVTTILISVTLVLPISCDNQAFYVKSKVSKKVQGLYLIIISESNPELCKKGFMVSIIIK